ncbi:cupin domain-containing protein [Paraburkholderia sp. JPY419]|uniref:cupin domain-containing protein n=1 Tax=Paraburkholderia sp. JPY419 TaxID=667660 RepID=UPI003D193D29
MTIQHIKKTTNTPELESWGSVGIPLSDPACELRGIKKVIPGREAIDTGVWECTPGRFRRQITEGEVMHILAGRATFTPDDDHPIAIETGDTVFLSPNTVGIWDIQETVRKVYVLL